MLKLQFKDQRKSAIWLVDSRYSIGRDKACDIVIDDEGVGALHAELRVEADDKVFLSDAGSLKGTFINGSQIKSRTQVKLGDVIRIHNIELELIDPKDQLKSVSGDSATAISPALQGLNVSNRVAASVAEGGGQEGWVLRGRTGNVFGEAFPIPANVRAVLGRAPTCDIVLPGNHVSRQHAELFFSQGRLHVKDLGSSNGTYVNRKKVGEAVVNPGDEIRFDTLVFEVEAPQTPKLETSGGDEVTRFQPAIKAEPAKQEESPALKQPLHSAPPADASPRQQAVPPASRVVSAQEQKTGGSRVVLLAVVAVVVVAAVAYGVLF